MVDANFEWFQERGFTPRSWEENGVWWVDLLSQASGLMAAPRYGRGDTAQVALASAQQRWRVEQDGEELPL